MAPTRDGRGIRGAGLTVIAAALLALWPGALLGQNGGATALRPGLVVQPGNRVAYVMAPEGGVVAVDLTTGAVRWTSAEGALPLAVSGNVLLCQVAPRAAESRVELVGLDAQRGTRSSRGVLDLPRGVRVSLGETLDSTFSLQARASGGAAVVTWRYVKVPRQGMPGPLDDTHEQRVTPTSSAPATEGGVFRMNLATGALTRLDPKAVPAPASPRRIVTAAPRVGGPTTYESADGRHEMTSETVADDRTWEKYRWTLVDRSTRQRLGEFRTHVSFTPFVVVGTSLVYETTPFTLRGAPEQPAKLRSIDLTTGKEIWSVAVREIVFRGPFPPS